MSRRERTTIKLRYGLVRLAARMGTPGAARMRVRPQDLRTEFFLGGIRVVVMNSQRMLLFSPDRVVVATTSVRECVTLVEKAINCGL